MAIKTKLYSCSVTARLTLTSTDYGGGTTAIKKKYTPLFCIGDECAYCAVMLQGKDELLPGEESIVQIEVLGPKRIIETIIVSQDFFLKV